MRKAKLVVTFAHAPSYEVRIGAGIAHDFGSDIGRALAAQGASGMGGGAGAGDGVSDAAGACAGGGGAEAGDAAGASASAPRREASATRVVVLADVVAPSAFVARVKASCAQRGFRNSTITVDASDALETAGELWRALTQLQVDDDAVVVAVGAESLLHTAGFVATAYRDGLPCAFVPTTLGAAITCGVQDFALLDIPGTAGNVRAQMHPLAACIDADVFRDNAPDQWLSGFEYLVQAAMMGSDDFFFWLSDSAAALRNRNEEILCEALVRALAFRSSVFTQVEQGNVAAQECLAYGTELAGAHPLLSLAAGMRFSALLAQFKGMISEDIVAAQDTLLTQLGLFAPHAIPAKETLQGLLALPHGAGAADARAGAATGAGGAGCDAGAGINAPAGASLVLPTDIGCWRREWAPAEELESCLEVL